MIDADPQGSLNASLGYEEPDDLRITLATINALVSSDSVLIPVQAAYLLVKGLQQLIKTILTVKKRLNRKLAIEGILLTMVDFRTNYARDIASRVHTTYGSQIEVFENVIPMSVKAAETSAEGKSFCLQNETRGHETPRFSDRLDFGTKCPKVQKNNGSNCGWDR